MVIDLIGLDAEVIKSSDKTLVGLSGTVVDETRNMLRLTVDGHLKSMSKSVVILELRLNNGSCVVNGAELIGKPEYRENNVKVLQ